MFGLVQAVYRRIDAPDMDDAKDAAGDAKRAASAACAEWDEAGAAGRASEDGVDALLVGGVSSFSDGPLGRFSPRSHLLTIEGLTLSAIANVAWLMSPSRECA